MTKRARPIMQVLEVLGRRWSLRVLWELRGGPLPFRALRERCDGVSPSVLAERLADLRALGVLETSGEGYALTASGVRLGKILLALDEWSRRELAG